MVNPLILQNEGCYRPIRLVLPERSIVKPVPPAPLSGASTPSSGSPTRSSWPSTRRAARTRSAAATRHLSSFSVSGRRPGGGRALRLLRDPGRRLGRDRDGDGLDATFGLMANCLDTPIEALELEYPLRVERYELRDGLRRRRPPPGRPRAPPRGPLSPRRGLLHQPLRRPEVPRRPACSAVARARLRATAWHAGRSHDGAPLQGDQPGHQRRRPGDGDRGRRRLGPADRARSRRRARGRARRKGLRGGGLGGVRRNRPIGRRYHRCSRHGQTAGEYCRWVAKS